MDGAAAARAAEARLLHLPILAIADITELPTTEEFFLTLSNRFKTPLWANDNLRHDHQ